MDNQHRKISGYRELNQTEIDLINEIKAQGLVMGTLLAKVQAYLSEQAFRTPIFPAGTVFNSEEDRAPYADRFRLMSAEPGRWAAISKTHMQEGIMALVRSVAQPTDGF